MAIGLGVPMVQKASAPRAARPPQEVVTETTTKKMPMQAQANPGRPAPVFAAILAVVLGTAFFCLPLAGVILLVMLIAARRTATMSQIQASLLAINAQLNLILSQKTPSAGA